MVERGKAAGRGVMTEVVDRPKVDPRFARRWIDARREEGRRRLRVVSILAAVLVCLAIGVGLVYSPLFAVRHVRVTVQGSMPAAQIVELAGLAHHPLMIDLSTSAVSARLDADPVLGGAQVSKHWPSSVSVSVSVRTPLAVAEVSGQSGSSQWAEIDATGRVLKFLAARPIGMPLLQALQSVPQPGNWITDSIGPGVTPGTPPSAEVDMQAGADAADVPRGAAAELAVLAALPPILRSDVSSIGLVASPLPGDPSHGGVLSMVVAPPRTATGTVTVDLGDGSLLAEKVTSLLVLLNQGHLSGASVIDLTVPGRPATLTAPQ